MRFGLVGLAVALLLPALPAAAQIPAPRVLESFPDLADMTLASPVILQATVVKTQKISPKQAVGLPPAHTRFLVEAEVTGLLRSAEAVPGHILYLWDAPLDAKGKAPKLKKTPVLLFLSPGGRPGEYRLTNAQAQIAPTATAVAAVKSVLTDSRKPELVGLRITGVGNAFHVLGSIPGESESQIFLTTADSRPVSIVVLSRPGQGRSYSIATGDIIDSAAGNVKRNTLLWYQLSCQLPRALPASATANIEAKDRDAVDDDYRWVLAQLGTCTRTLR